MVVTAHTPEISQSYAHQLRNSGLVRLRPHAVPT